MELKNAALKYALQNAVQFKGRANAGAVIGKLISENPEFKERVKEVAAAAAHAVKDVNAMKPDEQVRQLGVLAPELLERKKPEKRSLAELRNAVMGKVVTRIPPEPSKYAHVGHAISFMINYLYAGKYGGGCIVRFEDTNPELSKQEYVDAILDDLAYLRIVPSAVIYVSDDMDKMYSYAEVLIGKGRAYVCFCSVESMRGSRRKGAECSCRSSSVESNMAGWRKMLDGGFSEGGAVLRLKGDMKAKNTVLRDPVIFRVCDAVHYRHGRKYRVWPLYDFENAVEDGLQGVTHIMRSIEFGAMRVELQDLIKSLLGLPKQTVIQYGRFNITDAITQGREIRELINSKQVSGWDDPRLVTIKALSRRGIQPETFSELAVEVGLSATPTNIDWSVISAINRRYLDPLAKRYFFVENPQRISVEGAPEREVSLKLHPSESAAARHFRVGRDFFISEKDMAAVRRMKDGSMVRLMDCLNLIKSGDRFRFDSLDVERYKSVGGMIIHWLPAEGNLDVEVLMPYAQCVKGVAEASAFKIKIGEIVQFARFGFCRLERKEKGRLCFIYCHE